MTAPKWGNNIVRETELIQDEAFRPLMSGELKTPVAPVPEFKVPVFEVLRAKQPAEAWTLGYLAGWPEMRHG